MEHLFSTTLYLLALVNPVSKIFLLSTFSKEVRPRELWRLAWVSSLVGLGILLLFALAGKLLLRSVFHVEIYSFQIVGGAVLFAIGYRALSKGVFFEIDEKTSFEEMSIVPLASPMIAGPATITAAVSFSVQYGLPVTVSASALAVGINFLAMRWAGRIGAQLMRFNLMGALIRITGLVVATIAVQMVLLTFV